ncbi:porin [Roseomonas sp. OT10]|uniref:porin n=1 Tax=Roseomonas cutis TaxID=2897332 RepID=UPI001E35455C|nr:porin [Roseomonas sp. OT10]UFN49346.1 porin [Roseomonas sp. OT10]
MRKLLLGSTAVAAAALFAPQDALAQAADPFLPPGPPMMSQRALEVRVGGYFRFNYSFTDQDGSGSNGTALPVPAGAAPVTALTPTAGRHSANTGKSDFSSDAEIHITANGKAANGLRYGGAIELQVDQNDGAGVAGTRTNGGSKTTVDTDEMWMFVAGTYGQLRFGDEDGPLGGLMNSGHVTNFATGGVDGDWFDSVIVGVRNSTFFAGDVGDNTKIIYLSPQFFGFDVGASFAFNNGEGEDTGCVLIYATANCDRANQFSGTGRANQFFGTPRRRNETQLAARWRGSFGGVGIAVTGGAILADPTKVMPAVPGLAATNSAMSYRVYEAGAQVSAFGALVGGWYRWGPANGGTPLQNAGGSIVDTRDLSEYFVGASYTFGDITVGANYYNLLTAGSQSVLGGRRESAWSVGATYRVAPGLELVADYTNAQRRESGFDFLAGSSGSANNKVDAQVVIVGTRIAF